MTTIIMRKIANAVEIAYDSQTTAGNEIIESTIEKVYSIGSLLIGTAGNSSFCDALEYAKIKKEPKPGELRKWVGTYFIKKLKEVAKEASTCEHPDCYCEVSFQVLVMSADGDVVEIMEDFSFFQRPDEFYAIGSGAYLALGALAHGATAKEALQIAADRDIYTGGKLRLKTVLSAVPKKTQKQS